MSELSKSDVPFDIPPDGTVTFMQTDIEGSTQLLSKLGKGFSSMLSVMRRIIREILNDSVRLTKNDQSVVLTLAQGGYDPSQEPFVKKIGEDSWLLSADKVTDMVSNIDQYVGQVIVYQHREGGKPAGFRIRHLKEGNDFEKMGIQSKDIIKKVNGIEVSGLTDVVKAVYQLSDETNFTVELERGNQPKELNYQLDKEVNALVPIITNMINIPGMGGS